MKLYTALLVLLIAMCILAAVSMLVPEPAGGRGTDHPDFANMKHGGSGEAKHAGRLWLNWAFGTLSILVFAVLIAIGARKGRDLRGLGSWLWLTTTGSLIAWSLVVLSYSTFMTDSSPTLFLALPAPSAWMLYALLPTAAALTLLYVVGFRRWILTDQDLAAYEELLANRKPPVESTDSPAAGEVS